jgi:hypothetical protein
MAPALGVADVHVLDESSNVPALPGIADDVDNARVVDTTLHNRIELYRVEAGGLCRGYPSQYALEQADIADELCAAAEVNHLVPNDGERQSWATICSGLTEMRQSNRCVRGVQAGQAAPVAPQFVPIAPSSPPVAPASETRPDTLPRVSAIQYQIVKQLLGHSIEPY